jgi:hypothetical protein
MRLSNKLCRIFLQKNELRTYSSDHVVGFEQAVATRPSSSPAEPNLQVNGSKKESLQTMDGI